MNISAIKIALKTSADYKRICVIVYIVTALAIFSSGLSFFSALLLSLPLLFQGKIVLASGKPVKHLDSVILKQESWLLCMDSGDALEYERAASLLDNDFFQLLKFSDFSGKSRTLLLFHDQLAAKDLYYLRRRLRMKESGSKV